MTWQCWTKRRRSFSYGSRDQAGTHKGCVGCPVLDLRLVLSRVRGEGHGHAVATPVGESDLSGVVEARSERGVVAVVDDPVGCTARLHQQMPQVLPVCNSAHRLAATGWTRCSRCCRCCRHFHYHCRCCLVRCRLGCAGGCSREQQRRSRQWQGRRAERPGSE